MCTGGAQRPFLHDRHFSDASSFQSRVLRSPDGIERQAGLGLTPMAFDP
jgi:hypothetical protein